jgi:hypothetical protein
VTVDDAALNGPVGNPSTDGSVYYTVTVSDDDPPSIDSITGNTVGTTGDTTTVSVTFSDNIGVTVATLYYKLASAGSWSSASILSGSAGIAIPSSPLENWYYYVTVDDAALNGPVGNPSTDGSVYYTVTVSDNDPPQITNIVTTPTSQLINNHINITATITDNINLNTIKVDITGPVGFSPINTSMLLKSGNNYYYNHSYSIVGTYNYHIWAKDTSNNGITSSIYQFEIFAELQITELKTGWNFVSLPYNLSTPKTNLFIISSATRYTWGQAVSSHIVINFIYNWIRTTQGYGDGFITTLTPGEGYWMYAYNDCVLWATNLTPMIINTFVTHLKTGWNIVGVPTSTTVSKANLLVNAGTTDKTWADAVLGSYVMNDIFGWQRISPQTYFVAYELNPGYSYWLYAYTDCTLKRPL